MSWFGVAIAAYLLLAIVNLLDKFLVDRVLRNSRAYAFAACLLGLGVFLLAPLYLEWPGGRIFALNLLNGAIFAIALWMLYEALRRGEASRILVVIGGLTPLLSLLLAVSILGESYSPPQLVGLGLILAGVFLIAFLPTPRSYIARIWRRVGFQDEASHGFLLAFLAALAYALYFFGTKQAYAHQPFLSAFIWTRLGAALFVLLFLIRREDRLEIRRLLGSSSGQKGRVLVVFNQLAGSLGFILQNYAIFLGSVVLVNALQGVQYAFLLIISAGLAAVAPRLLKEDFSWRRTLQKTAAVMSIAAGLYFLAI